MSNGPIVSIIVPAYNQQDYISETLDSVLSQTYQNWECVIMNDGSTDDTPSIAESYSAKDRRFKLYSQPNGGLSSARNSAIQHARGEYILPLDADDLISPTYVEEAIRRFLDYPETKLVYCKADIFGDMNGPWELFPYDYERFLAINCIFCSCFFRREDYLQAGGYDEKLKEGLEDWDFLIRLLHKDDIVYQIPKVLFHYRKRLGTNNLTSTTARSESKVFFQVITKYPDIYKDKVFEMLRKPFLHPEASLEEKIGHILLKPVRLFRKFKARWKN